MKCATGRYWVWKFCREAVPLVLARVGGFARGNSQSFLGEVTALWLGQDCATWWVWAAPSSDQVGMTGLCARMPCLGKCRMQFAFARATYPVMCSPLTQRAAVRPGQTTYPTACRLTQLAHGKEIDGRRMDSKQMPSLHRPEKRYLPGRKTQ